VLVGHVDSREGPAVFYPLSKARPGEAILVAGADGSVARFTLTAVTRLPKTAFPTAAVFAPTPVPTLRLITCTGTFDTRSGHYLDSLILWATAA
jgi:hypothetical protein